MIDTSWLTPMRAYTRSESNTPQWLFILFCDEGPDILATLASYPNIIIRTFGNFSGSRSRGQQQPFLVHVFIRWPLKPWTNMILIRLLEISYTNRNANLTLLLAMGNHGGFRILSDHLTRFHCLRSAFSGCRARKLTQPLQICTLKYWISLWQLFLS